MSRFQASRRASATGHSRGTTPVRGLTPYVERAFTLVEVMVVVVILGVLLTLSVPSFQRTMEQSRAEIAAANLQAIWTAQRLYWLDHRVYAADMDELELAGLLDAALLTANGCFEYRLDDADSTSFTAAATRTGSITWSGTLFINEAGLVTGAIQAPGNRSVSPALK